MLSAGTEKMLSPASRISCSRSSRETRRSGSTTLIRNGSAGNRMGRENTRIRLHRARRGFMLEPGHLLTDLAPPPPVHAAVESRERRLSALLRPRTKKLPLPRSDLHGSRDAEVVAVLRCGSGGWMWDRGTPTPAS